ncbi:hypothetical protein HN385_03485 [archaeon]|jgi:hypothetical protein|nr:hypothetical protein [archaeon]MBT3450694.1 hypothetical protein [archaeon]MBT6869759.1 hypothetical protein [archaeon]MBT7192714.1 hypothetical protein [archaeon]MBT7380739.1 hypothetical protein [archaeon]
MPGRELSKVNNELIRAKSNLEQYLLICTSEGEVRDKYQEYVGSNFNRIFEGYSIEQLNVVGNLFTENFPKLNGIAAIDECVISTFEVIDLIKGIPNVHQLEKLKTYTKIFTEDNLSHDILIQGNELIKHYINTDIFPEFVDEFKYIQNDRIINSPLSKMDLLLGATHYFSQKDVRKYLVDCGKYRLSFIDSFLIFSNLMNIPEDFYGVNSKEVMGDYVCEFIKESGSLMSNGQLYRSIKGLLIQYKQAASLPENFSLPSNELDGAPVSVNLRSLLTKSLLKALSKNKSPHHLNSIFNKFYFSLKKLNEDENKTKNLLYTVNLFDNVIENLPKDLDYNNFTWNLGRCFSYGSTHDFGNFRAALNFIDEGIVNGSININYLEDSINFNYHKYHGFFDSKVRDNKLENYLSRPNVIKVLKLYELDNSSKSEVIDQKYTHLFHLLRTFESIFSIPERNSLISDSTNGELDIKEYFVSCVCDLVETFDLFSNSSFRMIKNFNKIIYDYNQDGNLFHLSEFQVLKDQLLSLSKRSNYHSEILPKTNEFIINNNKDNRFNIKSFFEILKRSKSVNDFNLDEFFDFMGIYLGWNSDLIYDFNLNQRRVMVETYSLLENSMLQEEEPTRTISHANQVKRKREILKGKLKGSFQKSLDEVIALCGDQSINVKKHEVINYCNEISRLVKENKFDVLSFVSQEGVQ